MINQALFLFTTQEHLSITNINIICNWLMNLSNDMSNSSLPFSLPPNPHRPPLKILQTPSYIYVAKLNKFQSYG